MLEDERKNPQRGLKKINLSKNGDKHLTFISVELEPEFKTTLLDLMKEYQDVFAWSYEEMPGLSDKLITHKLAVDPSFKPVKQTAKYFSNDIQLHIKKEIEKLLEACFIKPCIHAIWSANIVLVRKKNGQICIYIDFCDLNKVCQNDDFSLPNLDKLIDSTTNHEMFSFIDGFSGYNHIKMDPRDVEKIIFRTLFGNIYYTVIPFGLKKAGAAYHHAMTMIFHDIIHEYVEDYIDDLLVKSKKTKMILNILKRCLKDVECIN